MNDELNTEFTNLLVWYTSLVICSTLWVLFLIAFLRNNSRTTWLIAQTFLMLSLIFVYFFEKHKINYKRVLRRERV